MPKKDMRARSVAPRATTRTITPVGSPSFEKDPMFVESSGNAPGKGKGRVQLRAASPAGPRVVDVSAPRARLTQSALSSPPSSPLSSAQEDDASIKDDDDRTEEDDDRTGEDDDRTDEDEAGIKDDEDSTDEDGMEVDSVLIPWNTKTRTKGKILTAWFYTQGPDRIVAPPASKSLETPQIGDIFFHSVTSQIPSGRQLFLRIKGVDGRLGWWPVDKGYRRGDGYMLSVTPKTNEPSWVKEPQYHSNLRAEQKNAAASAPRTQFRLSFYSS
ncbi:hypothetical protein K466DRAFT_569953 [Polyporus arcularius HHB13444]|uniref:Uncharacterized protein n=1 Tax=Polyporus arcularius HHB13444 TaxID=1314778 RepID=A0A5C3NSC9_9APHY|nr:hypothetical protein K466DRAFT_569953 [Polyporus arcularius HHB13444]